MTSTQGSHDPSAAADAGGIPSLAEIERMGVAGFSRLTPETRAALNAVLKARPLRPGMDDLADPLVEDIMESRANLNELASDMLFNELNTKRSHVEPATVQALRQAYRDAGHAPPEHISPRRMLELFDGIDTYGDASAVQSYATAAALGMNQPHWAAVAAVDLNAAPYFREVTRMNIADAADAADAAA